MNSCGSRRRSEEEQDEIKYRKKTHFLGQNVSVVSWVVSGVALWQNKEYCRFDSMTLTVLAGTMSPYLP